MAKIRVTYDDGSYAEWETDEAQIIPLHLDTESVSVVLGVSDYRGPAWNPAPVRQ